MPSNPVPLERAALAEFIGTAFLLAAIVGSGIMAQQLTEDVGLQLFQNSVATSAALVALILTFISVSGAHFNPAVTITSWLLGETSGRRAVTYVVAQLAGAVVGVMTANIMFDMSLVELSTKTRDGSNLVVSEAVATLGLLLVIHGVSRAHGDVATAVAVGGYIAGAFVFTASTSFANPAVTVARMLSDTFAGIEPASAPAFIVTQLVVIGVAVGLIRILFTSEAPGYSPEAAPPPQ